ncbi:hypothetical protein GHT06_006258 [Daphnia sinensis]|uniref:Uncharacterized protein n=1 Tax=Daphnia sinensis TaxID=1820382 RepID=A0AAD5KVV2_9CRUS|nr:hypothetical protein GHT06_006258 [Daphnia sinensis]
MERARIQMEASNTSATETLSKALKGMGEQLSKLVDSAEKTSSEIAATTNLVKDARQSLRAMDEKIKEVNLDLNAQIEEQYKSKFWTKKHAFPNDHRHLRPEKTSPIGQLLLSKTLNQDPCPSCLQPPFDGNPKNYARFKAKFRALYESEYNGSPALLFMLEELLSKEVRNEIGECLADEAMYSVVWERLDAVYGRTEVMDQTYLDDLLQIPPLKTQDAANLKTFANRKQHGKNVFESLPTSTSKSIRFDDKKPVKKSTATHTSTIGHVTTEEGSKATASSPSSAAPMGRRPKTEERAVKKTDQWRCLACNGRAHNLDSCNVFMSFTPTKRAEVVFKSGRCLLCLTGKHERKECPRDIKCTMGRCAGSRHHPLLHGSEFIPLRKLSDLTSPAASTSTAFLGTLTQRQTVKRHVRFKIVPVRISVGARWVDTFGFLDTGSDTTLIRSDVVKRLGLVGQPKRINVVSYDGSTSNVQASVVTPNAPISPRQLECWTHLRGIDVPNVQPEDVGVLIGLDVAEAHDHIDSVKPPAGTIGPIAFKTPFGWCLGVKKFWQLEAKDVDVEQPVLCEDDLRGQRILESTVKNVGNRYQVGLMWKTDNVNLPDNRGTALKRLFSMERRFQRDEDFARKYDAVVKEYISLDHARLLTTDELRNRSIRVVFDGAAEYGGTSINQNLLRGPNLLVSLLGVLLRFRRNLIPVGADIEKMFHQVKVPVEDQVAYRFVYRTPGIVFLMKTLLQDIWTYEKRIDWDDPIPEELGQRFHYWYEHLENLELLMVPRCFRHQRGRWTQQHLHVFTDASTKGYGAVAYFRYFFEDQSIDVSFVMAKTHVTPVKGLTIPRLELQAAVEGLNIALVVCRELEIDLREVTFHTDSQTVLHLCSRGIDPKNVEELVKFHEGPPFLKLDPSEWNTWDEIAEPEERDVNVLRVFAVKTEEENHSIDDCGHRLVPEVLDKRQSEDGNWQAHRWRVDGRRNVGGPHTLIASEVKASYLRTRYWIIAGRNVIKSVVNTCWPCKRRSSKPIPPLMASLPVHRLTPYLHPFTYTGVDYFGPLTVRVGGRGCRHEKRWVCLFTCLTTRAVHLEVSDGLSLEEFMLCFTRFVSLRGKPNVVYSDNGTNLVAGEQELRQALTELVKQHQELQSKMACQQIEWHFSPSHGPHFGGRFFPVSRITLYEIQPFVFPPSHSSSSLYHPPSLISVLNFESNEHSQRIGTTLPPPRTRSPIFCFDFLFLFFLYYSSESRCRFHWFFIFKFFQTQRDAEKKKKTLRGKPENVIERLQCKSAFEGRYIKKANTPVIHLHSRIAAPIKEPLNQAQNSLSRIIRSISFCVCSFFLSSSAFSLYTARFHGRHSFQSRLHAQSNVKRAGS